MNAGVIQGGWEFVWAAYGVSALILIGLCGVGRACAIARARAGARRRREPAKP